MKFNSYHERGGKDPGTSHDFEDITYVLNNRIKLSDDFRNYPEDVQIYLKEEFKSIIKNKILQSAILGFLPLQLQTKRFKIIMAKLKKVVAGANYTN